MNAIIGMLENNISAHKQKQSIDLTNPYYKPGLFLGNCYKAMLGIDEFKMGTDNFIGEFITDTLFNNQYHRYGIFAMLAKLLRNVNVIFCCFTYQDGIYTVELNRYYNGLLMEQLTHDLPQYAEIFDLMIDNEITEFFLL